MGKIDRKTRIPGLVMLASVLILSGCWREDFEECPETAEITLVTEWSDRAPDVDIPEQYRAVIGDYSETLSGVSNTLGYRFAPGTYRGYVHNLPAGMSVGGGTVSVDAEESGIRNDPGYLFTWSDEIAGLRMGERREIPVPMRQQTGEIRYEIAMEDGGDIADYVKSINGVTVSGIASSFDLQTGEHSDPSSVLPLFALESNVYAASSRILGTAGASQQMTIKYELEGGSAGEQILTKDITSFLDGFNRNKTGEYRILFVMLQTNISGRVTLVTQWDERSADASIPAQYDAKIGTYAGTLTGTSNNIDYDFSPGDYRVNVYNTPAGFEVENMYATVEAAGNGIDALPGYLFTYTGRTAVSSSAGNTIYAPMVQQVGTVGCQIVMKNPALDVNNYISAVSAQLSGVASRINLENAALSMPSSIAPVFTPDGLAMTAASRILGTVGSVQTLTLDMTLTGSAGTQTLTVDAGTLLAGFNADKRGSYDIVIELETVDGLTGAILGWTVSGGFTGDLD